MIYPTQIKQKAIALRKKGLSYGEIGKNLTISKNTIKYWCHNVILKPADKIKLYTKQIRMLSKGPASSHDRRQNAISTIINNAENEINFPLSTDTYKLFGAALYWAEGNKISDFTVTNSDPLLIKFMTKWFCDVFHISPFDFKAHLNIYPQQNEQKIKKFWSDLTGIPLERFGKTFIKPNNKNYKKNTLYYGTIKIRVRNGTDLRHRVFGWINAVLKEIKIDVEVTERKWYKLKADYKRS